MFQGSVVADPTLRFLEKIAVGEPDLGGGDAGVEGENREAR